MCVCTSGLCVCMCVLVSVYFTGSQTLEGLTGGKVEKEFLLLTLFPVSIRLDWFPLLHSDKPSFSKTITVTPVLVTMTSPDVSISRELPGCRDRGVGSRRPGLGHSLGSKMNILLFCYDRDRASNEGHTGKSRS